MRIDAHQHFWSIARGDYGWLGPHLPDLWRDFGPADLAPKLAAHGIDKTVLVQAAPSIEETDYMLGIADVVPWVGAVVGWIDFANPSHEKHIRHWARHRKLRGLRPMLQDLPDPRWILRPEHAWAFEALAEHDLHFEFLGLPSHLETAAELIARYPNISMVLDHGMKPAIRDRASEPWAARMAEIARTTKALCKISGLVTEAAPGWTLSDLKPYIDHLVAAFGADRLMWGSDWPVVSLNGSYESWRAATLALLGAHPGAHEILGGTAMKFYRMAA
jgi:L-fuconolactonase